MLIRGLCASGVKLVVCSRAHPVELVTLSGVGEVELGPLSVDEVTQFLRPRLPKVRNFGRLLLECAPIGGHQLGLELYCSALSSGGVSHPNVLEGFLHEQVWEALSDSEKFVLSYLSVFRGSVRLEGLRHVSPRTIAGPLRGALYSLEKRGLIKRAEGGYTVHEIIRDAAYSSLADPRLLHLKAVVSSFKMYRFIWIS